MSTGPKAPGRRLFVILTVVAILSLCVQLCQLRVPVYAAADPNAIKVQGSDTNGLPILTQILGSAQANSLQTQRVGTQTGGNQINVATLGSAANQRTYLAGFAATAGGATAPLDVTIVTGGTAVVQNYTFTFPTGATASATPVIVTFSPPIQASADNTNITVTLPAGGAGNTNASITAWGFSQ